MSGNVVTTAIHARTTQVQLPVPANLSRLPLLATSTIDELWRNEQHQQPSNQQTD
jgi:hypothetical protein